ncbi:beta-xylosidase [Patella vulgata]|uniref:beta-xylosidase n=1 Tax=Patella vulgata TaxID=6465 RepID=UPI0024A908C2|nr:beta-xylosidase [Patella vulgata]
MSKPLWNTRIRLGEFDPPQSVKYKSIGMDVVQSQAHRDLALEAAMKSFVLLKNDNSFLPLDKNHKYDTIAIVGPHGDNIHDQSGGYSPNVMGKYSSSIKDGLSALAKTVNTVNGCKDDTHCNQYDQGGIQNAVKNADVVFVCLGLGNKLEHEGTDRRDLNIPGHQIDILKDSISHSPHNTKIVLLIMSAGPLDIEQFDKNDKVAAIIQMFYPAQATGEALRRLISHAHPGDVFSGRLPMTWMTDLSKVPPMTDYSMKERTYRYITYDPLYPFGYGLSYTTFKYSNLKLQITTVQAGGHVKGSYDIQNTGPLDADEVSQVYVKFVNPSEPAPNIQLASFHRTHLRKGEKKTVHFIIHGQSMSLWNDNNGWIVAPGTVNVFIGGQQPNQHRQLSSNILQTSYKINGNHTFGRGKSAKWYPTTS